MKSVLLFSALVLTACTDAPEPTPPYLPVGDVAFLMAHVVEPAADKIWDSSGFIVTAAGEENLAPTTEEEWLQVKHGASVVAEAGNLLMLPERSHGREEWNAISRGLVEVGRQVIAAVDARDADALFDSGAALYGVCLSCHQVYWAEGGRFTDD